MKGRLLHPLWTHIPAIVVLLIIIRAVVRDLPMTERLPVHFNIHGLPDRYGSPWEVILVYAALPLAFILVSIIIDELWARHEQSKTFNWMSLLDELNVGIMGGLVFGYLEMLTEKEYVFIFPWKMIMMIAGPTIAAGVVLELIRPHIEHEAPIFAEDTELIRNEVAHYMKSRQPLMYWESQKCPLLTIPMMVMGFGLIVVTFFSVDRVGSIVMTSAGLFLISIGIVFRGMTVTVMPDHLVVKLEAIGTRLLTLKIADIIGVRTHVFSPLQEFGGWGIRRSWDGKTRGYYWRGNKGVLLTMSNDRKVIIGSDHPDRLAAVIGAMKESQQERQ